MPFVIDEQKQCIHLGDRSVKIVGDVPFGYFALDFVNKMHKDSGYKFYGNAKDDMVAVRDIVAVITAEEGESK